MKSISWFWIIVIAFLVIGRISVPTVLDLSITSQFKDFAHLFLGGMWAVAWREWKNSRVLMMVFWALAVFEILMVVAFKQGLIG